MIYSIKKIMTHDTNMGLEDIKNICFCILFFKMRINIFGVIWELNSHYKSNRKKNTTPLSRSFRFFKRLLHKKEIFLIFRKINGLKYHYSFLMSIYKVTHFLLSQWILTQTESKCPINFCFSFYSFFNRSKSNKTTNWDISKADINLI